MKLNPPDVTSVDEFIAGFYEGARLDSQGVFTVDLERRMEKLSKFQLSAPEHFALALMRVATLGGAEAFRFERHLTSLRFHFDGVPFTHQELEGVAAMLARSAVDSGSRRLQSLGYALLLVANLQHGSLRFASGEWALVRRGRTWILEASRTEEQNSLELDACPKLTRPPRVCCVSAAFMALPA